MLAAMGVAGGYWFYRPVRYSRAADSPGALTHFLQILWALGLEIILSSNSNELGFGEFSDRTTADKRRPLSRAEARIEDCRQWRYQRASLELSGDHGVSFKSTPVDTWSGGGVGLREYRHHIRSHIHFLQFEPEHRRGLFRPPSHIDSH